MNTDKFDPNLASRPDSGIFGLPYEEREASIVYLPVPWEATTSYGGGTSLGPKAIYHSSKQVDLFDSDVFRPYEAGLYMLPENPEVLKWNDEAKVEAQKIIAAGGDVNGNQELLSSQYKVNQLGDKLNQYVYQETRRIIAAGKTVGIVGGDHSVTLGGLRAIAEKHPSFGILHFDAHSDTRKSYEGFNWSHASIMYNALESIPQLKKLVQVGIRDYCEEEFDYCTQQKERVRLFTDRYLQAEKLQGVHWARLCQEIIQSLPQQVWISFDIDGLDPSFCPHTGTPVPGGLNFQEANYLMGAIVRAGKKIIGFDLTEVAPDPDHENNEWDANVGARLLYKLSAWTMVSQGKAIIRD
jgi:agmatinase